MADPFIRVRGLEQKFGSQVVLRGVDLDVVRGETLVLLGGSGGGKSVLLKHLPGLLRPWKGSVVVDGVDISTLDERALSPYRRKVGIMFQGSALFDSMSVGENVAFPLRESGGMDEAAILDRVSEVLEIVRLPGQQDKMPADLSGGMRKRVALARAVVGQPACVLYDEPHAGLDPITADSIDHLIKDLQVHHGMTNVVVTHEMRSVFHIADRVVFLQEGRIHWSGSPEELKATRDPVLRPFVDGDSGEPWP
jgi:phospholipid/cholesterol/gamma-HCH transport system ATP-binding protein